MAWYDTVVDHTTVITASIWNSMITYLRGHKSEHITGGGDIIPVATQTKTGLCPVLDGVTTHYLDGSGNWTTPPATVTNVTGSAPIVSTGGTTPAISISAATTGAAGSMSSADKTKLDGIEALADVTDAGNVAAAGALMTTCTVVTTLGSTNTTIPTSKAVKDVTDTLVTKALYDANSILYATTDDIPAALSVGASTIVGRKASGNISAMSASETRTILNVADGANAYSHPNHSGDVTSSGDGATTIAAKAVTLAKMNDMATASLLGRNTSGTGAPEVLSATTARSLLNVESGADVTDATNVAAAGAVMDTDYNTNFSVLTADTSNNPSALTIPASTILGRKATGGIVALYPSEVNTLLGTATQPLPVYAACVYQDGTYTYAIDKDGNVLNTILRSDNSDNIPIQLALDSNSDNASKVYLMGTFNLSGDIYIHPWNSVELQGKITLDTCTIYLAGVLQGISLETGASELISDNGTETLVTITHYAYNANGIVKADVGPERTAHIDKIYFYGGTTGIYLDHTHSNNITNNRLEGLTTAILVGGSGASTKQANRVNIIGNVIEWGVCGIKIVNAYGTYISGNTIEGNSATDIDIAASGVVDVVFSTTIIGNYFEATPTQILVLGDASNNTIIGINIISNIMLLSTVDAINIEKCWNVTTMGNRIQTSTGNVITKAATAYNFNGTNDFVDGGGGFGTTRSSKTNTTLSSGNGTIAHGSMFTPWWAVCTATTPGNIVTVTSIDATNITVHVSTDAGADGTTQVINWMCGI